MACSCFISAFTNTKECRVNKLIIIFILLIHLFILPIIELKGLEEKQCPRVII